MLNNNVQIKYSIYYQVSVKKKRPLKYNKTVNCTYNVAYLQRYLMFIVKYDYKNV